jgi:hypothetical protein
MCALSLEHTRAKDVYFIVCRELEAVIKKIGFIQDEIKTSKDGGSAEKNLQQSLAFEIDELNQMLMEDDKVKAFNDCIDVSLVALPFTLTRDVRPPLMQVSLLSADVGKLCAKYLRGLHRPAKYDPCIPEDCASFCGVLE